MNFLNNVPTYLYLGTGILFFELGTLRHKKDASDIYKAKCITTTAIILH